MTRSSLYGFVGSVCFLLPFVTCAQLTSTNYQVYNPVVTTDAITNDTSSTNYQTDPNNGSTYTYDAPVTTITGTGGGDTSDPDPDPELDSDPDSDLLPDSDVDVTPDSDTYLTPDTQGGSTPDLTPTGSDRATDENEATSTPPVQSTEVRNDAATQIVSPAIAQTRQTPQQFLQTYAKEAAETVRKVVEEYVPVVQDAVKTAQAPVTVIGTGGGLGVVAFTLLRVPFSLSSLWRILIHLWSNVVGLVAFKKRRRAWGTVYDSVTKAPIDPAYVELFTEDGKRQAEAVTDLDGRYGFLVPEGTYVMRVRKTNYTFPSAFKSPTGRDVLYTNLYYGTPITVSDTITRDIPVDPLAFDWNQFEKMRTKQTRFIHRLDPYIVRFLDAFFYAGMGYVTYQWVLLKDVTSTMLLFLYVLIFGLRFLKGGPILFGSIIKNGYPLPFAVVRIFRQGKIVTSKVTDENGRYVAIVPPGMYTLKIDERQDQKTFVPVYEVAIEAKRGVINKNIVLT